MRTLVETQMIEDPPRFISFVLVILVSRGATRNKIRFFYQLPRRSIWLLHLLLHNVFCFEDLLKICIFLYQSQRHCLETITVLLSLQKIRCKQLAKNPMCHARTKHMELEHHFIREKVLDGTITVVEVRSQENVADIFTKSLLKTPYETLRAQLGVISKKSH